MDTDILIKNLVKTLKKKDKIFSCYNINYDLIYLGGGDSILKMKQYADTYNLKFNCYGNHNLNNAYSILEYSKQTNKEYNKFLWGHREFWDHLNKNCPKVLAFDLGSDSWFLPKKEYSVDLWDELSKLYFTNKNLQKIIFCISNTVKIKSNNFKYTNISLFNTNNGKFKKTIYTNLEIYFIYRYYLSKTTTSPPISNTLSNLKITNNDIPPFNFKIYKVNISDDATHNEYILVLQKEENINITNLLSKKFTINQFLKKEINQFTLKYNTLDIQYEYEQFVSQQVNF
tara:strand:- start:885 stop:1742 length:858 start_codon:yes stop_codon:yes gene_type:complete